MIMVNHDQHGCLMINHVLSWSTISYHRYANMPLQYTAICHGCENGIFPLTKCYIFLMFAQNIDCWYTLVPTIYVLEQKYENNVYPCKPQFCYIKVGCKGVFITRTCYHDDDEKTMFVP